MSYRTFIKQLTHFKANHCWQKKIGKCILRNVAKHYQHYHYRILVSSLASRREHVWGSGGIAPPFLCSALDGGEWSTSRHCRFSPGGQRLRYPLDRKLVGAQSQSGCYRQQKDILLLPGIEPRLVGRPAHNLVDISNQKKKIDKAIPVTDRGGP
jgi:hypothetical protein